MEQPNSFIAEQNLALLDEVQAHGIELQKLITKLRQSTYDQRWVSIGATDLQTGLMALNRAIARPDFF